MYLREHRAKNRTAPSILNLPQPWPDWYSAKYLVLQMTMFPLVTTNRIVRRAICLLVVHCILWSICSNSAVAADTNFARDVLPVLSNKCFVCHGPDSNEPGQLRLDTFAAATADRGGYSAINVTSPDKSELLARIFSHDDPMPPGDAEKQLTPAEKKLLKEWVLSGGKFAQHWSFVKPKKQLPQHDAGNSPIDGFIFQELQKAGIDFAPLADNATLARRAALTLTGLPPDADLLRSFLNDPSPSAYDNYVDKLLNSPRFGEHQARYWLDAVRYGDTHGLHLDNKRGIFPYRDWVVQAFNDNLPLNEFIKWQLAGDLLPAPTISQLVATGFVRMNPSTGEGGAIAAEFQAKNNFDRVETFGTVFLGMSLTCARCHTHKYDPIPQTEYYRLMAFFNSTAEPALDRNKYDYGPTVKAPTNAEDWSALKTLEAAAAELLARVQKSGALNSLSAKDRAAFDSGSQLERLQILSNNASQLTQPKLTSKAQQLVNQHKALEKRFTTTLVAKDLPKPRETKVLRRGEYDQPLGDRLAPGVFSVMGDLPPDASKNRAGLAAWLTSPDHPLVSRVLMNRIWQRTFGDGLVRTPEDFGLQGQQPTHPELLDWLAVELQERNWNSKHMLRLMVTSRTFRQSSRWRPDIDDPENRLFARGPAYRLDAEVLRDIGLWASGLLNPAMGGEGVKPYQPSGMWQALAHPGSNTKKYERDKGQKLYRRSLYVYWKRTSPHPMMTLFDAPDRETSCVRRSRTNTSLQSLGLLNETQRLEMARTLADRLLKSAKDDEARIHNAFRILSCRKATATELTACQQLLSTMRERYQQIPDDAVAVLKHGEAAALSDFPATERAAWTQVAATILASDAALLMY